MSSSPSSMRQKRLQSDYESVQRLAHLHPRIEVEGVRGNPPEHYVLKLHVRSLRERGEQIVFVDEHRLEITLPKTYPRDAPVCRMLTPVFHPNIAPHAVCIGDHWTAAESLDLMIQRVGELLAFQSYNVKSPLNGRAAQWVEQHVADLPVDRTEFFVDLGTVAAPVVDAGVCSNCGVALTDPAAVPACERGHRSCAACAASCPQCGTLLCLCCGITVCPACRPACANCGAAAAPAARCTSGHALCSDCVCNCGACGRVLCLCCGERACSFCAGSTAAP